MKSIGNKQVHRFEIYDCPARSACIAGTFNDWHPATSEMIHLGSGHWVKDLVLEPGLHEYLFVVDGVWLPDPRCHELILNPFGGVNCVQRVPEADRPEAAH